MSRSPGSCPVEIADLYRDRLRATLEIGADGGNKGSELIIRSGLNADNRVLAEHIGPDIKSCAGTIGRNPVLVCRNYLFYGVDKSFLGEGRHFHTLCGVDHPVRIEVGAEGHYASVLGRICLETLENSLGVLENPGALTHDYHIVIYDRTIIPFSVLKIRNITLIGFDIAKAQICPIHILCCHFFRFLSYA